MNEDIIISHYKTKGVNMINNFDGLKKQLRELSTIINSFTSEAVQLKIIELLFSDFSLEIKKGGDSGDEKPKPKRKPKPKKIVENQNSGNKPKRTGRKGAARLLNELIDEGYFETKRGLNDIVSYCSTKKATTLKPGDFSTKLTRFVRDEKLKRERNSEGQYEYYTE